MAMQVDRDIELAIIRGAYARQVLAAAGVQDARLAAAFSQTRREDFLGPGPWPIMRMFRDYVMSPDADPVYLYSDDLVGIRAAQRINNGQPSLHAHLMHHAAPATGERIVHIGTGTGYYTAILAHLAGPSGRVIGIEHDVELAQKARDNLAAHATVQIIEGDGATVAFGEADVIYVNAGCTQPVPNWLDHLADGGRLILPMTSDRGFGGVAPTQMARVGAVFRIARRGADYLAAWISPVAIFPCAGSRDASSEHALAEAFRKGGWERVTRLYRDEQIPEARCWLRGGGWCLAFS
ncbi:MAG: methyltransferase domain-containing protein [Hyphomicrobiaceae bacterium]|nr:methyltransferase domain-containing protein [Hyphomicrobiaceae bacterium]